MGTSDKRKQSLYFPSEMLAEIQAQSGRLDRSLSWLVQYAWRAGRRAILDMPSHPKFDVEPEPEAIAVPTPQPEPSPEPEPEPPKAQAAPEKTHEEIMAEFL